MFPKGPCTLLHSRKQNLQSNTEKHKRRAKHILFTVIWRRIYGKGPLKL